MDKNIDKILLIILLLSNFMLFSGESIISVKETIDAPVIIDAIRLITKTEVGENLPHFILFLGRFHPLILHLPIGFFVAILFLEGFIIFHKRKKKDIVPFQKVSAFLALLGGIFGLIASSMGWLLGSNLEYDIETLTYHGYLCTAFSIAFFLLFYFRLKEIINKKNSKLFYVSLFISFVLLSIGGHLGGNLTHGEEYIFEYAPDIVRVATGRKLKPIILKADETSDFYGDVITSIMNSRCLYCHSKIKTKGKLRLDSYEVIFKGGENDGPAIIAKKPEDSPLYYRITILENDDEDDEMMPPKGKPRLTKEQIALIHWWIKIGAPKEGKVLDFKPSVENLKRIKKQKIIRDIFLPDKIND